DAGRDAGVALAAADAVGELRDGRQARAACALHVVPRGVRIEPGLERRVAREAPVARMLDRGARNDVAQDLALEPVALDERAQYRGQHLMVIERGISAVRPRER